VLGKQFALARANLTLGNSANQPSRFGAKTSARTPELADPWRVVAEAASSCGRSDGSEPVVKDWSEDCEFVCSGVVAQMMRDFVAGIDRTVRWVDYISWIVGSGLVGEDLRDELELPLASYRPKGGTALEALLDAPSMAVLLEAALPKVEAYREERRLQLRRQLPEQ